MQKQRRGLQLRRPGCGTGSRCRLSGAQLMLQFGRTATRSKGRAGSQALPSASNGRRPPRGQCAPTSNKTHAEDPGKTASTMGSKRLGRLRSRRSAAKAFSQADALQAGQHGDEATWTVPLWMNGGTAASVLKPLPEPETPTPKAVLSELPKLIAIHEFLTENW